MEISIQDLGAIGEFVSSIVIVVTLIYLTVQVKQNTSAIHSQTRATIFRGAQEELWKNMEFPDVTINMVQIDRDLSPGEKVRLDAWLSASMKAREFSWLQYLSGSIDENQWESEKSVIVVILGAHRTRLWWKEIGFRYFGSEFVAFVDGLIKTEQPTGEPIETIFSTL